MKKLIELEAEKSRLNELLSVVAREIKAEKERLIFEIHGVKPGVIIEDYKGKEHIIREVALRQPRDKPWVTGNPRRKDGTFGTALRNLYTDWKLK